MHLGEDDKRVSLLNVGRPGVLDLLEEVLGRSAELDELVESDLLGVIEIVGDDPALDEEVDKRDELLLPRGRLEVGRRRWLLCTDGGGVSW